MTKVYCVDEMTVHQVHIDLLGATPIRPIEPIVIQFGPPQAIDEWEIPSAPLSLAVDRETALNLAVSLYRVAMAQK